MNPRALLACAVSGALLIGGAAAADDDCRADIRGKLMRKETGGTETVYTAAIEVSARETCAMISFDLVVVESESGGEEVEVRVPKRVRVRDSTASTLKVDYKLQAGRTIVGHRFEQTGCRLCE